MRKSFLRRFVMCLAMIFMFANQQGCKASAGGSASAGASAGAGAEVCVGPHCGVDVSVGAGVDVKTEVSGEMEAELCGFAPCFGGPYCGECNPECSSGWSAITVHVTSCNYYEVWGGDYYTGDNLDYFCLGSLGFTLLGSAETTETFSGNYKYYVIVTPTSILLDAVQGSDNSFLCRNMVSWGNLDDSGAIYGPHDGNADLLGWDNQTCSAGFIIIQNPGYFSRFTF